MRAHRPRESVSWDESRDPARGPRIQTERTAECGSVVWEMGSGCSANGCAALASRVGLARHVPSCCLGGCYNPIKIAKKKKKKHHGEHLPPLNYF